MRIKFNVQRYWSKPWGFHRFSCGNPKCCDGWQIGVYLIGIEHWNKRVNHELSVARQGRK